MGYISQQNIDEIRERGDIVDIIQSYVPLKRSGRNFKANCPFHHEKTPSFMVSPDKQIFHCFGCGEGGNVFNFVMKYERLNFREALEVVAKKIGFHIVEEKSKTYESSLINKLYAINEMAARFYSWLLLKDERAENARQYLRQRGVTEETLQEFKLGFSLTSWDAFIKYAKKKGFSEETLEQAGLALRGRDGKCYDRFRGKLMFPITNTQGKVVGFGSRTLDKKEEGPKYINSPETQVYNKRKILYGLNIAKKYIVQDSPAVITEGYFDVIIPQQAGIKNIVGCLGTSFTPEQARTLKRYTKDVILLFDADSSGEAAALRGLDILIEEGLMVKIASLPSSFDADSLVREKGQEALSEIVDSAKDFLEYKISLLKTKYPLGSIESKVKITNEILPTIKKIENSVLKSSYIRKLAEGIDVSEQALWDELKKIKDFQYAGDREKAVASSLKLEVNPAEKMIFRLILEDAKALVRVRENLSVEDFEHPLIQEVAAELFKNDFKGEEKIGSAVMARIGDERTRGFVSGLLADGLEIVEKEKALVDCINVIKKKKLKRKLDKLESEIKYVESVKDEEKKNFLTKEFQRLVKEKNRLY